MKLEIMIVFKENRPCNFFLDHPYSYFNILTDKERKDYKEGDCWSDYITHSLAEMASHVPIDNTTLYKVCWFPDDVGIHTVGEILPLLIKGIQYMIEHRKELLKYEATNCGGTYNRFMKFLLNYKQACEDNDPECIIIADR